jgi:hypothetical protein
MVNALCERGYEVSYDELAASVQGGVFNRAHVAMLLAERGYVGSKDEAFATLLKKGGEIYKEPKRLSVYDAIAFVKRIGATAVLAHPLLTLDEERLRLILPRLCNAGLDAMEVYYSTYDEKTELLCKRIAKEHGLLECGGSDFHGERKADTALGSGRGSLSVKTDIIEPLMARSSFLKGYNIMKNELLFLGTRRANFHRGWKVILSASLTRMRADHLRQFTAADTFLIAAYIHPNLLALQAVSLAK